MNEQDKVQSAEQEQQDDQGEPKHTPRAQPGTAHASDRGRA